MNPKAKPKAKAKVVSVFKDGKWQRQESTHDAIGRALLEANKRVVSQLKRNFYEGRVFKTTVVDDMLPDQHEFKWKEWSVPIDWGGKGIGE